MATKEETISPFEAKIEASRCLECLDAPCARACPAHIDIPEFIRRIKSTNYTGAAEVVRKMNTFKNKGTT